MMLQEQISIDFEKPGKDWVTIVVVGIFIKPQKSLLAIMIVEYLKLTMNVITSKEI